VEASVALHGSIGLAATAIAAIADKAGVTRLTVYRHFPDETALFNACSAHWLSQQLPDPGAWSRIGDPIERLQAGLADVYRYYRASAGDAHPRLPGLHHDAQAHQQAWRHRDTRHRDVLAAPFGGTGDQQRQICTVIGHATSFWTWRSLCAD
jgi:AcrR family transcriptional regulator